MRRPRPSPPLRNSDCHRPNTYTYAHPDRNERAFQCAQCPKSFNRRDLLHRHTASHERLAAGGLQRPIRVGKACESCAASKVKCDDSRPCKRCRKRGQECCDGVGDGVPPSASSQPLGEEEFGFAVQGEGEFIHVLRFGYWRSFSREIMFVRPVTHETWQCCHVQSEHLFDFRDSKMEPVADCCHHFCTC